MPGGTQEDAGNFNFEFKISCMALHRGKEAINLTWCKVYKLAQ